MGEGFLCGRIIKPPDLVKRPERVERGGSAAAHGDFLQLRHGRLVSAFAEKAGRGAAMPFVRMIEKGKQLIAGQGREREFVLEFHPLPRDPVDPSRRRIDLILIVLAVGDVEFIHISDMERSIGRVREVDGTEGRIGAFHDRAVIDRLKGRAACLPFRSDDLVVERIDREEHPAQGFGHGRPVGEGPEVGETHHRILRRHHRQISEGVGIARWSELAGIDALHQVEAALHVMPASCATAVVPRVEPPDRIKLEPEGVATALGEDFEGTRPRVVSPDHAAFEVDARMPFGIEPRTHDAAGDGAALASVDPAIRTPDEAVRGGMAVLKSKP